MEEALLGELGLVGGAEVVGGVGAVDGEEEDAAGVEALGEFGEEGVLVGFGEVGEQGDGVDGVEGAGWKGGGEVGAREVGSAPGDGGGVDVGAFEVSLGMGGDEPGEGTAAAAGEIEDVGVGEELGGEVLFDELGAALADTAKVGAIEGFADAVAEEGGGEIRGGREVVESAAGEEEAAEEPVVEGAHGGGSITVP